MDEIENKLLTKDQTVIAAIISNLIDHIVDNYKKGVDSKYISFLQKQLFSSENAIFQITSEGILKLARHGIWDSDKLLEEIISSISNNRIGEGIVKTICGVLHYQYTKSSQQRFDLYQPQHPFLILVSINPDCFIHIYKEIRFASKDPSWSLFNYSFYQYCFCNPLGKEPMFYKGKLWINLLSSNQNNGLVMKLLNWLPFDPTGSLLVSTELLNELSVTRCDINTELILLLQVCALSKLISTNHDPRDTVAAIRDLLEKVDEVDCVNAILLTLIKTIVRALPSHALLILEICELLIVQPQVNFFVLQSLKACLLHWIGNPSSLSKDVCSKANKLFAQIENRVKKNKFSTFNIQETYDKYQDVIIVNQDLCISFELMIKCESWRTKDCILKFLTEIERSGYHFTRRVINLVLGLFICSLNDAEITLGAFKVICTHLENFNRYSHWVLTLMLYVLSNTSNSKIHFELFKYLPKFGSVSDNYVKVVSTIKALHYSGDDVLRTFGMRLMYDLWKVNQNTYSLLEEMLTQEEPSQHTWEFYINKAYTIRCICETNSKIYGEEMVAHLSRILSKCSEDSGELASSIAIDAISVLCSEGIIDIKTTWSTLAPKYFTEKRMKTVKSMFGLASAMSKLMHPEHHKELQKEVVCKIWEYAVKSADVEVKKAALDSLVQFGLENISPHFPEQYLNEESVTKTDLSPQLVPGNCWINFLKDQNNLQVVGDFIIKMIKKEVDEYPKYVYHITSRKEPTDYSLLPTHSLVRGVASYCITQMNRWKGLYKHVYIECMRILSQEYSKPLPPLNWSFLQQLIKEPELKTYCLTIATHQVITSGTARKLMENYIETLIEEYDDLEGVLFIYRNLRFLSNSMQPMIFERFFGSTLNYAQHMKDRKKNEEFIISLVDCLKSVLADSSVQDVGKKVIASVINKKLSSLEESDDVFKIFLDCMPNYPIDLLKNITVLPTDEMTNEVYRKALLIRCKLADDRKEKLKWLDDLIDRYAGDENIDYTLEEFLNVFKKTNNVGECVQWTVDLIGRIEMTAANNCDKKYLTFLIKVLTVAVVAFSGFPIFTRCPNLDINEYIKLFPQSANILLEMKEWSFDSAKVIECFYYLNSSKEESISREHKNMFGKTLQALRHHEDFKKENKWMKFMNASII